MKHIRIIVRSQAVDDSKHVHARLLLWRGEEWHVCGVFQLRRCEWLPLAGSAPSTTSRSPMSKPRKFRLQHPRLSENDVERACLDLLRLRGYWPIRLHAGRFKTPDGERWITGVDR
jgi:hypothetical protein